MCAYKNCVQRQNKMSKYPMKNINVMYHIFLNIAVFVHF